MGLNPGRTYKVHISCISAERMLIPGSSIVSQPVTLSEATYKKAWFFEASEADGIWTAYEGTGPDCIKQPGSERDIATAAFDDVRYGLFYTVSIQRSNHISIHTCARSMPSVVGIYRECQRVLTVLSLRVPRYYNPRLWGAIEASPTMVRSVRPFASLFDYVIAAWIKPLPRMKQGFAVLGILFTEP